MHLLTSFLFFIFYFLFLFFFCFFFSVPFQISHNSRFVRFNPYNTGKNSIGHPICTLNVSSRERESVKPWFFIIFNIILSLILLENFISKFHFKSSSSRLEDMKIFSVNINYFHQFLGFFDISLFEMN